MTRRLWSLGAVRYGRQQGTQQAVYARASELGHPEAKARLIIARKLEWMTFFESSSHSSYLVSMIFTASRMFPTAAFIAWRNWEHPEVREPVPTFRDHA